MHSLKPDILCSWDNYATNSLCNMLALEYLSGSTKVSMVYLNMVQEAQNVVSFTANLLKVSRKFQKE